MNQIRNVVNVMSFSRTNTLYRSSIVSNEQ